MLWRRSTRGGGRALLPVLIAAGSARIVDCSDLALTIEPHAELTPMVHASFILPGLYQSEYTPHRTWADALIMLYGMPVAQHRVTIQWPIDDLTLPDTKVLHHIADLGASLVRSGSSVVVMCERGVNRSGLVTALIVRELQGVSGKQAVALVQARRQGSLRNPDFLAYLESLPQPGAEEGA